MASAKQPETEPTASTTIPQSNGTAAAPAPKPQSSGSPADGMLSEKEFEQKNQRRLDLIRKDVWSELTGEECQELERLETEVGAYVRAKFTGLNEMLDRMEERARWLGYVP